MPTTPLRPDRRTCLRLGWGSALALGVRASSARPALHWHEGALLAFGTTVSLRAAHADAGVARRAVAEAAEAVQRVEQAMSLFLPASDLARLNRDGLLDAPAPDLVVALRHARSVAALSDGLFDVTVQPLWTCWQRAASEGRRPTFDQLARARALVDWRAVEVGAARITLRKPRMALTLNGIAQGYAADVAGAALRRHGIEHALIDAGEWLPMGRPPDAPQWQLGVEHPQRGREIVATLAADGRAVACSSDAKLAFSADHRDHHVLDPRTGRSPTALACVVVVAPRAVMADALSKPLMMGTAVEALTRARRWGVDVLTIDKDGRTVSSPGLRFA